MKKLARVVAACCAAVMMSAMSPSNTWLKFPQEGSGKGFVVMAVAQPLDHFYWHYRKLGDSKVEYFGMYSGRDEELKDGAAVFMPVVLPEGDYELIRFTTIKMLKFPPNIAKGYWIPAKLLTIRFHVTAGKATYLGHVELAVKPETEDAGSFQLTVADRSSTALPLLLGHYKQLKPEMLETQLLRPRPQDAQGPAEEHAAGAYLLIKDVPAEIP